MSLLYQAYLLKRKKGAREENKADLFDNTVHYWGEGEANNGGYLPAVGVGGGTRWFSWRIPYQTCIQLSHNGPSVLPSLAVKSKGYAATPKIPNQVINLILLGVTLPQYKVSLPIAATL